MVVSPGRRRSASGQTRRSGAGHAPGDRTQSQLRARALATRAVAARSESDRGSGARVRPRDRDRPVRPGGVGRPRARVSAAKRDGARRRPARTAGRIRRGRAGTRCSCSARPIGGLAVPTKRRRRWRWARRGEAQWSDPWTDEMLGFRRGYAALLRDATAYVVAGQFPAAIRILEQLRREKPDDLVLHGAPWTGLRRRRP